MSSATEKDRRGLVIVHTGDGKGKTTAALGLALRAVGNGMPVLMIQFIKGKWKTGEREAAKAFGSLLEIHAMGEGFTWDTKDVERDKRKVREGWDFMTAKVAGGGYRMLILDEINYVLSYDYIPVEEVLGFLRDRPPALHVVLTGRNAPPALIEAADLVTEMLDIKHPFNEEGLAAQRGIEF
ncbi:MAG: cob(I)yrinic acid a,c-diamide adenosyltransferase [Nitrospirae bacterium RBG_16_64_22]|nr:MAG: cob(I)yrinic acid a,c-diamide adenosyltransferase [Nitrospirae bacterium RBG_16_64_22]